MTAEQPPGPHTSNPIESPLPAASLRSEDTGRILVGVPRETFPGEARVALVPAVLAQLGKAGIDVVVEQGAGKAAGGVIRGAGGVIGGAGRAVGKVFGR